MRKTDKLIATGEVVIKDIIREHAHRTGMTLSESDEAVRAVFDIIKTHLFERRNVKIPRFGTFCLHYQQGQLCRLPQEHRSYIPARIIPKFRYSVRFKQRLATVKITKIHEESVNDNDLPTD